MITYLIRFHYKNRGRISLNPESTALKKPNVKALGVALNRYPWSYGVIIYHDVPSHPANNAMAKKRRKKGPFLSHGLQNAFLVSGRSDRSI